MRKDVEELDLGTDVDLIYFYKNIREYGEHIGRLAEVRVSDISVCLACYAMVEAGVLEDLGEAPVDREMDHLLGGAMEARGADAGDAPEHGDAPAADTERPPVEERFYIKNLGLLLTPEIGLYNKQIVDIIYYVYRKTGVSHFDVLFKQYASADDYLIELHLLMAKGSKTQSFDLSDIKETLAGEPTAPAAGDKAKNEEVDFFESSTGDEKAPVIGIGDFGGGDDAAAEDSDSVKNVRPFLANKSVSPQSHLDQAKQLLLAHSCKEQGFYTENVSTFLALKFDRSLFLSYVRGPHNISFYRTLNKFEHPPFFFYREAQIKNLLVEAVRIEGSKAPMGALLPGVGKGIASGTTKDTRLLYRHALVCNAYTLKHFVNFALGTFTNLSSSLDNYILVAQGLPAFLRKYRSLALFQIFQLLVESKITAICNDISECVLRSIGLYAEVFYSDAEYGCAEGNDLLEHFDDSGIAIDEEIRDEWTHTPKNRPTEHVVAKEAAADSAPVLSSIEVSADVPPTKIPDLDSSDDCLVQAFLNPEAFRPVDQKLAKIFLRSLYAPRDRKAVLNSYLLSIAKHPSLKFHLLRNLDFMDKIDKEVAGKILDAFCDVANTPWRFRAMLLLKREELIGLGVSAEWFSEALSKDRVFFVRHLLK
ncbi:hypothetical protein PAPHI01_1634 [Pancytospora philotis]|nr:hypothetical protein PAPHI01_1634 [Pancytospora philotis]